MGKKSRRQKAGAARKAASPGAAGGNDADDGVLPPIDLDRIDHTVCAMCNVNLDPYHWDDEASIVLGCCGHSICSDCVSRKDKDLDNALDDIEELKREDAPEESKLPKLAEIVSKGALSCSVCGTPSPRDDDDTVSRFVRLSEAGHAPAQYFLSSFHRDGILGLPQDHAMAVKWLKRAAEGGHSGALAAMGAICYHGFGPVAAHSYADAKRYYELGGNDAGALAGLGALYQMGDGVIQDLDKAFVLYRKSAEQGYPPGLFRYGEMLRDRGQIEEAVKQFEQGARMDQQLRQNVRESDVSNCQICLAECLDCLNSAERGGGDPASDRLPLILFWARRAVKNGNEGAKAFLAQIESQAHAQCQNCKKPDPQMKCSKCRGASYCDKSCQTTSWKAGHKSVCNALPVLNVYTKEECARCGKRRPAYVCEGCGKACYCNEMCQKAHWQKDHKDECQFL